MGKLHPQALVALAIVGFSMTMNSCGDPEDAVPKASIVAPEADPAAGGEPVEGDEPPVEEEGVEPILFETSPDILGEGPIESLALGDLDGDGILDLVTGDPSGGRVWINDATGAFADTGQTLAGDLPGAPSSLALGDLDGDGDLDLVEAFFARGVANLTKGAPDLVFINDGSGQFVDSGQRLGADLTRSIALGDVDGDSDLDLVSGENGPNRLRFNDGFGGFPTVTQSLGDFLTSAVALGDVDSDGDLDVVEGNSGEVFLQGLLTHEPNRVWFRYDRPLPYFPNLIFFSDEALGQAETLSVALGDLDGDGSLDLVEGNAGPDGVWLNDGSGTFAPTAQRLSEASTKAVALGDLDLDGDLDIAEAAGEGTIVWANRGDGTFEASSAFGPPAFSIALGDLDGDGDIDIVSGHEDGARVSFNRTR
jgi:hypothetical protein